VFDERSYYLAAIGTATFFRKLYKKSCAKSLAISSLSAGTGISARFGIDFRIWRRRRGKKVQRIG
jgi:hypothetical protein